MFSVILLVRYIIVYAFAYVSHQQLTLFTEIRSWLRRYKVPLTRRLSKMVASMAEHCQHCWLRPAANAAHVMTQKPDDMGNKRCGAQLVNCDLRVVPVPQTL